MGKKMKLPHLNDKECERILSVINRDFDLRQREKERLRKIEQDLSEAAAQRSVLAKRKEFNEKGCIHCCSTFNLLFNKRLQCRKCKFFVCRNCASWDSRLKSWLCSVCEIERNLYRQSCEWFYDHLKQKYKHFGSAKVLNSLGRRRAQCVDSENDSGYGHSAESNKIPFSSLLYKSLRNCENDDTESLAGSSYSYPEDEESLEIAEVKQHIENVVEGLIGQSLDNARVDKPYSHPQYLQLFNSHHDELVEALKTFYEALHYALQNKPPVDDVTPTTTHAILKKIIVEVSEQASSLPHLEESSNMPEKDSNGSVCSDSEVMNSNVFNSYEDLLASAIINKMVEMTQKKYMTELNGNNNGIEEVYDHSDLDVPLTPLLGVSGETHSEASESDKEQMDDSASSIGGIDAADDEFTWANGLGEQRPKVEYIIVERIEEEVTREEYTDGEGQGSENGSHVTTSLQRSRVVEEPPVERGYASNPNEPPDLDFLNAWDMVESHKVPFPEFGVDLINEDLVEEEEEDDLDVGSRLSSASNWEENWRFSKKKRFPSSGLRHQILEYYADPPCMLIPNPAAEAHAQIGERDVDQLSELSERNSVGSLEFPDSDDEMQQENSVALVQLAQTVASEFSRKAPDPPATPTRLDLPAPKYTTPAQRPREATEIRFIAAPSGAIVHSGKMATFDCEVTGARPFDVVWFRRGELVQEGGRFQMYTRCNRHVLNIYDTTVSDAGTFSCVAYGKSGEIWRDFELQIKATTRSNQAPDFVVPLRVVSVEGCTARLSCTVTGYPEPRLFIYCQKKLLVPSDKYFIENAGYGEWTLDIACVGKNDEGLYEAVVVNRLGKAFCCTHFTLDAPIVTVSIKPVKMVEEHNSKKDSKKVTACIPNVVQRTWPERVAELERKKKSKSSISKDLISSGHNHYQEPSSTPKSPIDLNSPPRPGTIAEREHRKWMNATPLANNPYSPENVNRRRLERKLSDMSLSDGSITFEEYEKQQHVDQMLQSRKDLGIYQRDYYVNALTNGNKGGRRDTRHQKTLNSLKERVCVSADKVLSLETRVRQLEQEVQDVSTEESVAMLESQVAKTAEEVDNSSRQVCRVESEVEKLRQILPNIHSKSSARRSILQTPPFHFSTDINNHPKNSSEDETVSLPSVRSLATKFTSSENSPQTTPVLNRSTTKNHRIPDKNVIIVDKLNDEYSSSASQSHSPRPNFKVDTPEKEPVVRRLSRQFSEEDLPGAAVKRVHSLTARSLSREFRQHAQKNLPRPMNRTRSVSQEEQSPLASQPQSLDQENGTPDVTPGYTSDESSISNTSLPREKTKKRLSRSILQRASYWEKRAEQGLLSDNSVSEDFPIMFIKNDER